MLVIYAVMTVIAAALAAVTGLPSLFAVPEVERLVASLVVAAVFALAVVQGGKLFEEVPWYRRMAVTLKRILMEVLGPRIDGQRAFVIAVYSSVGEEAFFRGFLQPWIIVKLGGWLGDPGGLVATVAGVIAASLIFGLVHFPTQVELRPWTGFAVLIGAAFGALAAWSGSIAAPVLAHLLINWLNLRRLDRIPLDSAAPERP